MKWRAPFPKFGVGPGIDRVRAIASELGVDLAAFGRGGAVIVGSNGKGSTAAMSAAVLEQAGASVGLFTSPHLLDLNERFRIDGQDIDDRSLERHWARVHEAAERSGEGARLGAFEFLFLIAADWFAARGCAHTVWEAGIGGRLDPVRLIAAQHLALTSLDLEHTALLGDTLEQIACDKLDAAPRGAHVFVSESCIAQRDAIEAHGADRGLSIDWVGAEARAPLMGAFQLQNAALAVRIARSLASVSAEQIDAGLAATRWPGRLEQLAGDPLVVIDVGHTPAAVRSALEGFAQVRGDLPAVLVVGVSADKDVAPIVDALAPAFSTIVCTAARHKGANAALIAKYAYAANPDAEIIVAESICEARALALARARGGAVYVAGGLFLAAEFKAVHLGRDPDHLGFF